MMWRWDQGRLDYFSVDNLRSAARALLALENVRLDTGPDPLRGPLTAATGLPFSPRSYRVWRNYARVYKAALLATNIGDILVCTEWCRDLARQDAEAPTVDEYLLHFARNFSYPSPAFAGYTPAGLAVYPVCALLKLLVAKAANGGPYSVGLDEVFQKLIGRGCTGQEDLAFYATLTGRSYSPSGDEPRQVRELLRFISQISFLKWRNPEIVLDLMPGDAEALGRVADYAVPNLRTREADPDQEVLALGRLTESSLDVLVLGGRLQEGDEEFIEGNKVRANHLRTERSQRLRRALFQSLRPPFECDFCALSPPRMYPWVSNLLEVHHLLPLSSAIRVEARRTSIRDLVPICPNCHRAVHLYYRHWLYENELSDFGTKEQAVAVYLEAKDKVS